MTDILFLHVPCRNAAEAKRISRILIEERLAACVNIVNDVDSIYRWKGKIKEEKEVLLLAKTIEKKSTKLIRRIKELHRDECPAILVLPVVQSTPECIQWVQDAVAEA